jgi:hypothetical protein
MTSNVKRSVVCLVLLLGLLSMTAIGANKNRIGTSGAQELLIPVGARGIALGFSGSLFIKGLDAIYWNPAGLSRMDNEVEVMFSHMSYIADIGVSYGAVGVNVGDFGHLGFTLKSLSFGDIPETTELYPDGTGAHYSPAFLTLGMTFSKELTDRISVGATGYLLSEKILDVSATGMCFDIGLQYQNLGVEGLALSVVVKSVGPNMTFDGSGTYKSATANDGSIRGFQTLKTELASFEMPSNLEIGLAFTPRLDESNNLAVAAAFRNNNYTEDEYNIGAEYSFMNMMFLRGGYTLSPQTDKDIATDTRGYIYDWSLGMGVHYNTGGVDLSFDYAYRNVKYFDGNQVFTLKVGF